MNAPWTLILIVPGLAMASRVDCCDVPFVSREEGAKGVVGLSRLFVNGAWDESTKDEVVEVVVAEEDASAGIAGDGDAGRRALEGSSRTGRMEMTLGLSICPWGK